MTGRNEKGRFPATGSGPDGLKTISTNPTPIRKGSKP